MVNKRELFSRKIPAGRRIYYIDVKLDSQNERYLVISESRFEEERQPVRTRVMVFREDFNKFFRALEEARDFLTRPEKEQLAERE